MKKKKKRSGSLELLIFSYPALRVTSQKRLSMAFQVCGLSIPPMRALIQSTWRVDGRVFFLLLAVSVLLHFESVLSYR